MARLETAANISMVVLCVAITSDVAYRHLVSGARRPPEVRPGATEYRVGDRMDAVTGLKYETSTRTLLMVVKSTCGFCRQSMTFYKQLASLKGASGHSQLVAACLEDAATCSRFFRDSGVAIDAVVSVQPGALRIRGTPTLLLVNSSGTIERIWTGKLTEQGERDVLTTVAGF